MPPQTPVTLPVLERRAEIERTLTSHRVLILCGETGSGKTTQLPQICLDLNERKLGPAGLIGHTQPRRLAARAVAARIAEERNEPLGGAGAVGVKVRFLDQTSPRTRIKVMTDGILLAEIAADPLLRNYGTLIIDEAHERSLNIDFLLGYLKLLLPKRSDLRIIITSATIDTRRFSNHFGGPEIAPILEISGRTYPVEVRYHAPDPPNPRTSSAAHPFAQSTDSTNAPDISPTEISPEDIADAVEELHRPANSITPANAPHDILVFLPGEREIRLASDALKRRRIDAEILPLFSRLTNQEQDRIFHPAAGARQRIILATNVAETSLTVPGIAYVVDTGLARISRYDAQRKVQRLPVEPISQASANQRSGRCGRVASGICIRLYPEASYRARPTFTDPEIRRANLASVILQLKALAHSTGDTHSPVSSIETFPFIDPPDLASVRDGYHTLFELGAITSPDAVASITPLGQQLARIPLDPRIARMLLGAQREQVIPDAIILAAALSIQDPRENPMGKQEEAQRAQSVFRDEQSDFITLLNLWNQYAHAADTRPAGELFAWCREHFLSPARMREWGDTIRQLTDIAEDLDLLSPPSHPPTPSSPTPTLPHHTRLHRALLTGLISNVACREGDGSFDYRGIRGNTLHIFPGSVLFKQPPRWIMAAELVQTSRLFARTVARVDPDMVEELAGHMFLHQRSDAHLDADTGEPSAWERVSMSGIVVVPRRRAPLAKFDHAAARALFLREALAQAKWNLDAPFMHHNRAILERARTAEARLRRRDVLAPESQLIAFFNSRIPPQIAEPHAFNTWRADAERTNTDLLKLSVADAINPSAQHALDSAAFPDHLALSTDLSSPFPIAYTLAPGKDDDGLTVTIPISQLANISADKAAWLVPGLFPDLVLALFKSLPKADRALLERNAATPLDTLAAECAQSLLFGEGPLTNALSESLSILHDLNIPADRFNPKALPAHLRFLFRITDDTGKPIATDRDLPALLTKLAGRIRKSQEQSTRSTFERTNITTWDFGPFPPPAPSSSPSSPTADSPLPTAPRSYPTLLDQTTSVSLTLTHSPQLAATLTRLGLRRLFALACADEISYSLDALADWHTLTKNYQPFGTVPELRDALTLLTVERTFIEQQPPITNQAEFEDRLLTQRGRLALIARETGDLAARALDSRAKVAQRLARGTSRTWADSIADIREHAAYLLPRGFLSLITCDQLRKYPRYAEGMRERLFALKEDGSKAETAALQKFLPYWKRFTAHVATAMAAERHAHLDTGEHANSAGTNNASSASGKSAKNKAPLPQTRRVAPAINLDAGEWAMRPGNLTPPFEQYRWSLEDLRLALFASTAPPPATIQAALVNADKLWIAAQAAVSKP